MKKAFTLAEMMIVLVVIAIITSILLPAARHATPDENILKFKKAHNTLYTAIRELVNSDKYYLDGDLGIKADGTQILGGISTNGGQTTTDENLIKYFCNSFADIISTKSVNCSTADSGYKSFLTIEQNPVNYWELTLEQAKAKLDTLCAEAAATVGEEIVTNDGIIFYQANPAGTFGMMAETDNRVFSELYEEKGEHDTSNHKPFCIDIDGINQGEAPFGYGIRYDGKIVSGARADEWLAKSINKKD